MTFICEEKIPVTNFSLNLYYYLEMLILIFKYFSSPPNGIEISVERGEKFKICEYNWWDHSLALGIHRYTDT